MDLHVQRDETYAKHIRALLLICDAVIWPLIKAVIRLITDSQVLFLKSGLGLSNKIFTRP
jgi:hypothetical protein